ncbi:sigma-70 family RNA polymerase sigma factor [Fimbriiglobus ruber]|uniref:ECF RNA polymerase sigma factor SigE n=1 Tax=Fimbriiglobus ruber TaxID=1908690 RepID=A0A225DFN5_9BACT|nr:sigma-70 family RNA polymerase sigma factor [Fimbriiglobus ruber]OWK36166.1 hypothetical protein FRUB_08729 [Fimbriiglobus ruber]
MPEHLIRLLYARAAPGNEVTDAELLARVVGGTDGGAFELLVRRHAGLVWRVCRGTARDHHAAEDAFQATFWALARNAGAVREGASVAGWLCRVAYRVALKARSRGTLAPLTFDPPGQYADPAAAADSGEVAPILYAELDRLPDKYRVPVVLCHLHGFTQVAAAGQLGVPVGTVATRVRRGLDRLRAGLARRGITAPLGVALTVSIADAAALPDLVSMLCRAGHPPADILTLSEGVVAAMNPLKWKPAAAVLGAVVAIGIGIAFAADPRPADEKPTAADKPAARPADEPAAFGPADYAARHVALANLKKIGLALFDYHDEHDAFPDDIRDKNGRPLLSWRVAILPYLGQHFLYKQFKLDEPWDGPHNKKLVEESPEIYWSARPVMKAVAPGCTYFQRVAGKGALFEPGAKVRMQDVGDGLSNTLSLVEAGPPVPWSKPADVPFDPAGPPLVLAGPFVDAVHVAMADCQVFRMKANANPEMVRKIITRDGAEVVDRALWAAPARPTTAADLALLVRRRAALERLYQLASYEADSRFELEQALRKAGQLPRLDPTTVETLDELDDLSEATNQKWSGDGAEVKRLQKALQKTDPEAAARLKQAHDKRMQERAKVVEEQRPK